MLRVDQEGQTGGTSATPSASIRLRIALRPDPTSDGVDGGFWGFVEAQPDSRRCLNQHVDDPLQQHGVVQGCSHCRTDHRQLVGVLRQALAQRLFSCVG